MIHRKLFQGDYLQTEVNLWQIGDLRMATIPGEITPDLGLRIKAQSPSFNTMLVGLANDELGYLLPQAEYNLPIYRYERTLCPGPEAGDLVLRKLEDLSLLANQQDKQDQQKAVRIEPKATIKAAP